MLKFKELQFKNSYVKLLEFDNNFDSWVNIAENIKKGILEDLNLNELKKCLSKYTDIDTNQLIISNCCSYYMFDKDGNVYKVVSGYDEQCDETFNDVEEKYFLEEMIDKYRSYILHLEIKENLKHKEYLLNQRESNDNLDWLKKEIVKIIDGNMTYDSDVKDVKITSIQVTTYMEEPDYVKDIILIDSNDNRYQANRNVYKKIEDIYDIFNLELDEEVCTVLNNGFNLI